MKVKVRELRPNPFRDIGNYPINLSKVDTLKQSIEQTGFWDNILARKKNGYIEIAYGHHRLEAIKGTGLTEIDIPVKDLSDETMLKVMANENMNEFDASPIVIQETVRAVRDFLENSQEKHTGADEIYEFLGGTWKKYIIINALILINAIDKNEVDENAVNKLPTIEHATNFVANVKRAKIPKVKQRIVADEVIKSKESSKRVSDVVYSSKYATNKPTKRVYDPNKIMDKVKLDMIKARTSLEELIKIMGEVQVEFGTLTWKYFLKEYKELLEVMTHFRQDDVVTIESKVIDHEQA